MGAYRGLYWAMADVRCPFYIKHSREDKELSCEGYVKGSINQQQFGRKGDRERFMGRYCVAGYESCPVYKSLMQEKYGEG